jgi:hypothetical protein
MYYQQLDKASKSGGDILPFLEYSVQGLLDGLKSQLKILHEEEFDLTWRDYVYRQFKKRRKTPRNSRIRDLVLGISKQKETIPMGKIYENMPKDVIVEYLKVQPKTLLRDLRELTAMNMIVWNDEGVRAKREEILPYLPFAVPGNEKDS